MNSVDVLGAESGGCEVENGEKARDDGEDGDGDGGGCLGASRRISSAEWIKVGLACPFEVERVWKAMRTRTRSSG